MIYNTNYITVEVLTDFRSGLKIRSFLETIIKDILKILHYTAVLVLTHTPLNKKNCEYRRIFEGERKGIFFEDKLHLDRGLVLDMRGKFWTVSMSI